MKRLILPLLLTFITTLAASAGEFDPARVAADAKWWLHADLEGARSTELGQRIVREIDAKKGDQLRALKRLFSINPLTDLRGITLFGDGRQDHAVAVIEGGFDRSHLEDLVRAAEEYSSEQRDGLVVHSWTDKGKRQHAAFVRDDLLVFSHFEDLLDSALGALKSGGGLSPDPFVAAGAGAPFLVGSARLSEVEMKGDESKLLGNAEVLKIAVAEAAGRMEGRMRIEVGDPAVGDRFRKVMEGIIALGELGNPALEAADLGFQAQLGDGGRTVLGTLSIPTADMITILEKDGAFDRIGR